MIHQCTTVHARSKEENIFQNGKFSESRVMMRASSRGFKFNPRNAITRRVELTSYGAATMASKKNIIVAKEIDSRNC